MAISTSVVSSASQFAGFRSLTFPQRRRLFLVALAMPAFIYVLGFGVYPLLKGIWYSLYDYSLLKPARTQFVGFENYRELMFDSDMQQSLINTILFTIASVFFELLLAFAIALALWRDDQFNRICLTLILVPVTITPLVVGLIFKGLLLADYGLVGYYLSQWGLSDPRGLFASPRTALATLIFIDVWEWTPLVALILLAGLKALPTDILEAAAVDGAKPFRIFRLVTLPLMLPSVLLALTIRTIDAFRVFDSVFVTTGGGPGNATNTLMVYAVKEGLSFFNIGKASAIANVSLLCTAIIAACLIFLIRHFDKKATRP
ncbi:carbohydrate ABC transporter permease [Roseibium aggregatum]|uniref:Trehalose transport system permease protein SugA n=1 Tax=Roseibium aggregatum TaxID=187304 RepID=A0A0M6YBG4_9HYPH|nr:sugar ABC transporter permease [Roseibium aggregatum]CTQ47425.1 Trehalose transport system permease protein SugA [Roseibium aggregatum]